MAQERYRAVRRGLSSALLAGVAAQGLSVLSTVVLARLLTPADFGLVAAANVAVGLAAVLTSLGFAPSILRAADDDRSLVDTLFWTALALSLVLGGALVVSAPLLAEALGQPAAVPVLTVLAVALAVRLPASVPRALLQRRLLLSRVHGVETLSVTVHVAVAVGLAAGTQLGPLAIAWGQLAASAVMVVGHTTSARYRPRGGFRLRALVAERRVTGGSLASSVLDFCSKNVDYLVVSRALGAAALGQYYVAFVLPTLVRQRLTAATGEVLLPLYARRSATDLGTLYLRSLRLHAVAVLPALAVLGAAAEPAVRTFFGDDWDAAARCLPLIALATAVDTLVHPGTSLLYARGRADQLAALAAFRVVLLAVLLFALLRSGATTLVLVAGTVVVAAVAHAVLALRRLRRHVGVTLLEQLVTVVPAVASASAAAAVAAWAARVPGGSLLGLLSAAAAGAVAYVVVFRVVFPRAWQASTTDLAQLLPLGRLFRTRAGRRGEAA